MDYQYGGLARRFKDELLSKRDFSLGLYAAFDIYLVKVDPSVSTVVIWRNRTP